jgi:glutathione S-transferase
MSITLYELVGKDDRRYSQYCWRVRMAIAHKGLSVEYEPCRHGDVEKLAFSGQAKVPVIIDGDRVVSGSWDIACYLDDVYPDRPALMAGAHGRALTRLINIWADTQIDGPIVRSSFIDILHNLHPDADAAEFRATREGRYNRTLEQLAANDPANRAELNHNLAPVRELLDHQQWINGATPAYADHILFGSLQFSRCLVGRRFIEDRDPIAAWFSRMCGVHGGLANTVPVFADLP